MPVAITTKLRIKKGDILYVLNEPDSFQKELGIPSTKDFKTGSQKEATQIHLFVHNKSQLGKEWKKLRSHLEPGMILWIYFPKQSSGIQTDLSRDKGWDILENEDTPISSLSLISLNETWSAFGYRVKNKTQVKNTKIVAKEREVFKWVNPVTKEVKIPDSLKAAFRVHKKEASRFHSLSFTCQKEYIEWIVTAKKQETIDNRIEKILKLLSV